MVVNRGAADRTGPAGATAGDRGQLRSWFGLLILALAWGSTFLWIDLALAEGIPPALLTFGRAVVATAALLAIGWPMWRSWNGNGPRARDLFLAAALCNAMPFLLFSLGQRTVASGVAGVLNATTPLWTVLLEVALSRGRRVGSRQFAGVAIGFVGVCLVFAPWRDGVAWTVGVPLILLAAAGYAAGFVLMARRLIPTAASPRELASLQMLAATVLLALAVPFEPVPSLPTAKGVLAVVMLGTLCTAFTFTIAYRMLATEGATRTAVVGYLIPVVAVLLGVVFLSERIRPMAMLGMLVVLAGVAWTRSHR
jgi:drug/metabolite transporter (DMT)-like permease